MSYNTGIVPPSVTSDKIRSGASAVTPVSRPGATVTSEKSRGGATYSPTPPADVEDRAVINPTVGPSSYGAAPLDPLEPKRNPVGSWSFVILPLLAYGAFQLFAKQK
jgi:hypothetical protein